MGDFSFSPFFSIFSKFFTMYKYYFHILGRNYNLKKGGPPMRTRITRKSFTAEAGLELVRGCHGRICRGGGKVAIAGWRNSRKMSTQREEQALSGVQQGRENKATSGSWGSGRNRSERLSCCGRQALCTGERNF